MEASKKYLDRFPEVKDEKRKIFSAMMSGMDDAVGQVLAKVRDLGQEENTIIFFFSDNGGVSWGGKDGGPHQSERFQSDMTAPPTSNLPLRNGKASLYEGGVREPCLVVWPGITQPATTCGVPTIHVDLYPTLLEMTGVKPLQSLVDGISLAPLLKSGAKPDRDAIFWHYPHYHASGDGGPAGAVRAGDCSSSISSEACTVPWVVSRSTAVTRPGS